MQGRMSIFILNIYIRFVFKYQSTKVFVTFFGTPVQECISIFILNIYICFVSK